MATPAPEVPRDEPLDVPPPRGITRRSFVKGCIYGSAAAMAVGGAAFAVPPLAILSSSPLKRIDYIGATLISGPAPQGIALLPLKVSGSGEVEGNADPLPGKLKDGVLNWYRYCAHEATTGLQKDFQPQDEKLRYFVTQEKEESIGGLKAQVPDRTDVGWFLEKLGDVVHVDDFKAVGYGAGVNWRSAGQSGKNIISAIIIKIDPAGLSFKNLPSGVAEEDVTSKILAPLPDGKALVAYVSFCKHFCCVPGWHESPTALKSGFFEQIFCTCHFSVYDPLQIKGDFFTLQEAK